MPRNNWTNESDAFWELELFSFFQEHWVSMGRISRQGWERGQDRNMLGHLAKEACVARGT